MMRLIVAAALVLSVWVALGAVSYAADPVPGPVDRTGEVGDLYAAFTRHEAAMGTADRPDSFDEAKRGRCAAARGLARAALNAPVASTRQGFDELVAARDRLQKCPSEPPEYALLDAALQELADVLWQQQVVPNQQAKRWDRAFSAATPLIAPFPGTVAVWGRYVELLRSFEKDFTLTPEQASRHPSAAALYAALRALADLGDQPDDPAWRPPLDALRARSVVQVAEVRASLDGAGADAVCAGVVQRLNRPGPGDAGATSLRARLDLARCTVVEREQDAVFVRRWVDKVVKETIEEVCTTYRVPVTTSSTRRVCGGPSRCYQTSNTRETCFQDCSYVTDTRTTYRTERACSMQPVSRTIDVPRSEELPGRQKVRTVTVAGQLEVVDAEGGRTQVPFGSTYRALGPIVRATTAASAPSDASVVTEGAAAIAQTVDQQAIGAYLRDVATPRFQAAEARARQSGDPLALVELGVQTAFAAGSPELRAEGRRLLAEKAALSDPLIDGALDRARLHPTPFVRAFEDPPFDWKRVDITGPDAIAVTGTPFFQLITGAKALRHAAFPTQPARSGVALMFNYRMNAAAAFLKAHLGFIYQDQLDAGASFGGLTSEPVDLPDEWSDNRRTEFPTVAGYRLAYTGMFGHRGLRHGVFAGVRLQQLGDRTGYVWSAGAAMPLVVQVELRPNPFRPTILQLWGGDLNVTKVDRSLGGSLHVPALQGGWLYLHLERRDLRTQFLGMRSDDRVDAGRRPAIEAQTALAFSIF